MTSIKRLTILALLTTIALTIFVLESAVPPLVPIPGVKLGLANIVTLFLIVKASSKDALIVLVTRILLAAIFAGQMLSFSYSLAGGLLCFGALCLCHRLLGEKQLWFSSMIGAIFHNIGQIAIACFILGHYVLYYLPVLLISGIVTGVFTGLCCIYVLKLTKRLNLNNL